jgi:hypothetical protein
MTAVLRVEVVTEVDDADWDERMLELGAPVFHSFAWSRFQHESTGGQPLFVSWVDAAEADTPLALAVAVRTPHPATRVGRLASRLLLESPPAAVEGPLNFVTPLQRWARDETSSVVEIHLGSFDARRQWLEGTPPRASHRFEFLLEPGDQDAVFRRMRKGTRYSIRRAERLGVTVARAEDAAGLRDFAELYRETRNRLTRAKGVNPSTRTAARHVATLEQLTQRDAARLFLAYHEDQPAAGCLFGVFGERAYYLQGGSNEQSRASGAVHLALFRAFEALAAEGVTTVNLGGVSAEAQQPGSLDHGLYEFKRGMGAEPVPCTGGTAAVRPVRGRLAHVARGILRR